MVRTNKYITSTRIANQLNMEQRIKLVASYLAANRTAITPMERLMPLFSARPLQQTPISEIFTRCVVGRYLDLFATIADPSPSLVTTIPDILTMPSLVVDLLQCESARTLSGYPEVYNKIIMNITHLTKLNKRDDTLETSALHELHSIYVKALLVRSYFVSGSTPWLTPVIRMFIIRTYSLFIANTIARQANLAFSEMNEVASVFALYMCQLLEGDNTDVSCPPSYLNINFLGTRADLLYTTEVCQKYTKQTGILTLPLVCQILSDTGPARLKDYNLSLFVRHCSVLGSYNDSVSTLMAFEHPAYWVHHLLATVSGARSVVLSNLLKQYNLKTGVQKLALDIMTFTKLA